MKNLRILGAAVLCLAAGAAGFVAAAGRSGSAPGRDPLCCWLRLSSQQSEKVRRADPAFDADAARLSAALRREREKLAALLDRPQSPDDAILAQVEKVIAAHNALERRVVRHLLAVRPYLNPGQQRRLMGLCANGVRQAARRRWRGGRGESTKSECGPQEKTNGYGRGRGRGGRGRGPHRSE